MRGGWAAFRTPVEWEAKQGNRGDGPTFATAVTMYGDVADSLHLSRDAQGGTVTEPVRIDFPHDSPVSVGDRLTVSDRRVVVHTAGLVRGPFGVPHHQHVEAL